MGSGPAEPCTGGRSKGWMGPVAALQVAGSGAAGSRVFHVRTNGAVSDVTGTNRLATVAMQDGLLIDLDESAPPPPVPGLPLGSP